jgi:hypothetical protein
MTSYQSPFWHCLQLLMVMIEKIIYCRCNDITTIELYGYILTRTELYIKNLKDEIINKI